jgi:hypothetical protein
VGGDVFQRINYFGSISNAAMDCGMGIVEYIRNENQILSNNCTVPNISHAFTFVGINVVIALKINKSLGQIQDIKN